MSQQPHFILQDLAGSDTFEIITAPLTMDELNPNLADGQGPEELLTRQFTLVLVSHSHAPPLLPEPHLKYDLRKMSNPPKHIRDAYDGRSKRLREHMVASGEFCALLDTAQARIVEQMSSFTEIGRGDQGKHIPTPGARLRSS